eukprot:TRINITY_DN5948_c0_g1_i1.p1 TRINITY_DN5948_c0_g1~~TRINITY_DN5948_c0_g1_i1.p1  ORF type:complete len:614 (+),score=99.92 TRINITY_DN5948_c0_g1_i1:73-1914(+)
MQLKAAAQAAARAVYVIHVVLDDLGYNDFGYRNNQSVTPVIDGLRADGVELPDFYVFKSCAPSRASVLSGRYPWHVGYAKGNGNQNEAVPLAFDLLPAYLKKLQPGRWATHALGKWHIGWAYRNCTPPGRGFDSFLGTSGNIQDHWDHLIEDAETWFCSTPKKVVGLVEGNATADGVKLSPATWAKGHYGARVLTERTRRLVEAHPVEKNLYVYLAYHNVHTPLQAPLDTVARFGLVSSDVRRVYEAMLTEADTSIGRIMDALRARGMLERTVFLIHSDNGGAKYASSNWPLRGEKFTYWEGGLRAVAIAANPGGALIPASQRGRSLEGIGHLSDWYYTIAHGIAGAPGEGKIDSGPIAADSVNLWPWITGAVKSSPRTTVVHSPLSKQAIENCAEPRGSGHGCAASVRSGDWKLIVGDPGDDALAPMPQLLLKARPFLHSSHEHCAGDEDTGQAHCRGEWLRDGITHQRSSCTAEDGPCLFNVRTDPSESYNVASEHPELVRDLTKMLEEAALTEAPPGYATTIVGDNNTRRLRRLMCRGMLATGHDLPADFLHPDDDVADDAEESASALERSDDGASGWPRIPGAVGGWLRGVVGRLARASGAASEQFDSS